MKDMSAAADATKLIEHATEKSNAPLNFAQ